MTDATLSRHLTNAARGSHLDAAAVHIITRAVGGRLPGKIDAAIEHEPTAAQAWIDWDQALNLAAPLSGGERRIISIAASLVGYQLVNLSDVLTGLDEANALTVLQGFGLCLNLRPPARMP